jgi:hypothetical protein
MATSTQDWIEELKGISVLELADQSARGGVRRLGRGHGRAGRGACGWRRRRRR